MQDKAGEYDVDVFYEDFKTSQKYTPEERALVERITRGQSQNDNWCELRKGLITASNFKRVESRSRTLQKDPSADPGPLLEFLMGKRGLDEDHLPEAIKWGRDNESEALKLYESLENCQGHKKFNVESSGLVLSESNPFVGCSPDGKVTCQCSSHECNQWLLEVKCPFKLRELHPNEAASQSGCNVCEGVWTLDSKHKFYTQIQGQLGVCGFTKCVLIIYTQKGILPVVVKFDAPFYSNLMSNVEYFAKHHLLVHILKQL